MLDRRRRHDLRMGCLRRPRAGVVFALPAFDCALEVVSPAPRLVKRVSHRLRNMFQPVMEKPVPQPNDPAERSRGFVDGNHRIDSRWASGSSRTRRHGKLAIEIGRSAEHTSEPQYLMRSTY